MKGRWGALILEVPAEHEETVLGLLGAGVLGAETRHLTDGRVRLSLFLSDPSEAEATREAAASVLSRLGVTPDRRALTVRPMEDGRWVESYLAGLRPFYLGEGFQVVPGDRLATHAGRHTIRLVPGRAFGTGEHPTTRMCAAALERVVRPGDTWVDLGCGTAILSMVAAVVGAGNVLAIDDDPEAVEVAGEVLQANGLSHRVRVVHGSGAALPAGGADGIVANIAATFHVGEAGALARGLRPAGLLLASGFLIEDADTVGRALTGAGLSLQETVAADEWALLVACRQP